MESPAVVEQVSLGTTALEAIDDETHGVVRRLLCPFHEGMIRHARCRRYARADRSETKQPGQRFARAVAVSVAVVVVSAAAAAADVGVEE